MCMDTVMAIDSGLELYHYGVLNQKWGTRRYQNSDGSLTPLGRIHYGVGKARYVVKKAGSSAKSGMSKTGDAIRKKVKPTNEELQEKYDKAKEKLERKNIKNNIKNLGKKKKISDMTDEEVSQYINRLNNERIARQLELDKASQKNKKPKNISDMDDYELANYKRRLQEEREVRALEKDKKQGAVSKIFEEAAKKGLATATNKLVDKAIDNIFKTEEKVKYSDLFKEAESKLKFDVLTGDKDVAGQAASRLADLRGAASNKSNNSNNRRSTNEPNPEYSFKNDINKNASRTADDRSKANSKSARDKEPPVNAHVYNVRNLGGPSQSSKSAQQTTSSKSSKKKSSFNPFGKKTSTKSASETFRDVINSNSKKNAKSANDFSETASKFSKAANDLIDKHKNDKS